MFKNQYSKLLSTKNCVTKRFGQLSFYSRFHAFIPSKCNHEPEQLSHAKSTTTLIFIGCVALTLLTLLFGFIGQIMLNWSEE
jgi:hypothetical protein